MADQVRTIDAVAARFEEAASTSRRLPPVRVQGYFNTWPVIARSAWEAFSADEKVYRPFPPSPAAIDRMLETMHWVQWLGEEQRHLVWMRAKRYGWRDITIRFACDRSTAWRRWQRALETIAERLNAAGKGSPPRVPLHIVPPSKDEPSKIVGNAE